MGFQSYFGMLPVEILIEVLKNLQALDLMNFLRVYPSFNFCLHEKDVVSVIDFSNRLFDYYEFGLDFMYFNLTKRVDSKLVKCLNINNWYWLKPSQFKFLTKLNNLEELYVVGTPIELKDEYELLFNPTKLKKLAVNVYKPKLNSKFPLPHLTSLYLHITATCHGIESTFSKMLPNLKELWVDINRPYSTGIDYLMLFDHLTKFYCKSKYPMIGMQKENLTKYYVSNRCKHLHTVAYGHTENMDKFEEVSDEYAKEAWRIFEEIGSVVPYSILDANTLVAKQTTLDKILFQGLNFCQMAICVPKSYSLACLLLLKSKNASKLKKLAVPACLFQDFGKTEYGEQLSTNLKYLCKLSLTESGTDVILNLHDLEELEIFNCPEHFTAPTKMFSSIIKLSNLRKLTLELTFYIEGNFLEDIFKYCKFIQSFRITARKENVKLNYYLKKALVHAHNLMDFRYENYKINLNEILECLCSINKLKRLCFICTTPNVFTEKRLKLLLDTHKNLIFLYFAVNEITLANFHKMKELFKSYQDTPIKMYLANKGDIEKNNMPQVHYNDMVEFKSHIGSFDVNNFVTC